MSSTGLPFHVSAPSQSAFSGHFHVLAHLCAASRSGSDQTVMSSSKIHRTASANRQAEISSSSLLPRFLTVMSSRNSPSGFVLATLPSKHHTHRLRHLLFHLRTTCMLQARGHSFAIRVRRASAASRYSQSRVNPPPNSRGLDRPSPTGASSKAVCGSSHCGGSSHRLVPLGVVARRDFILRVHAAGRRPEVAAEE